MATYKDINSSVRIGGGLTLPAGSITLGSKITLDNTSGQITATKFSGDGSLLTNLSSAAMTDVVKLDGTRTMTGSLIINKSASHIMLQESAVTKWHIESVSGSLNFVQTSVASRLILTPTLATISIPLTVSGNLSAAGYTITGTTINATGNLQENGTNLSAKYLALAGGTLTAQLKVAQSTNTPAILLEGATAGWASGIQLNNTTATTGRKYGLYSSSNGTLNISDETAPSIRFTMDSSGNFNFQSGSMTTTNLIKASSFFVGATLVVETDAKIDWNKIKNTPATYLATAHTHLWADITDKPSTFIPSAHTHLWADITDKPTTFTPAAHTHLWADITDKPATFAPSAHTHAMSDVTGLSMALSGKLDTTANAVSASKWATARTITLGGDLSGSASMDGTANVTLSVEVTNNSHDHDWVHATDKRDVKPTDTTKAYVRPYFTSLEGLTGAAGTDYQDLLVLNTYTDASGGKVNALAFDKSQSTILHYQAGQSDTTWGTPKTIAYTDSSITGNAATATSAGKWTTARTVTLGGDLSGNVSIDGSANATLTATVADDSHNHTISTVTGLQTALDGKSNTGHTHVITDVTGLQTALSGKSDNGHTHLWVDITDKPATFTPSEHTHAIADVTGLDTALSGKSDTGHTHAIADVTGLQGTLTSKVDVIVGKGLSTNDYTTAEQTKLSGISTGATKTQSSTTNGNIKIDGVETAVYTHPANHPASIITQDASNRFVTDTEKTTWNAKAPTTQVTITTDGLMIAADKVKLNGISTGANKTASSATNGNIQIDGVQTTVYTHPTGDGNLHVPGTSTTNNNKVLKAGATAGSLSWGSIAWSEITSVPTTFSPSTHTHAYTDVISVPTSTILGRVTASTGAAEALTAAQVRTLINVADGANNYTHPSGDGNLHIPATSTTNNNKVLKAGATAGSLSWGSVAWGELTSVPATFTPSTHTHAYTDIVSVPTTTILGRKSAGAGATESLTKADILTMLNVSDGANNYTHPIGDGNLHVPATGTSNNGKILKAGSTAGSLSWATMAYSELTGLPTYDNYIKWKLSANTEATPADITSDSIVDFKAGSNITISRSGNTITINSSYVDTNTDTWRPIDTTPVSANTANSIASSWAYTHMNTTGNGGHVPAAGSAGQFLAYDGTWQTPPDTNTDTNNYLTGVSGSGNGTITFTRSGLANLTLDTSHNHDTLYLGKTAKAADSDKLDGLDSTAFMKNVTASYSSVTGDDGTDGWYTLFTVNDTSNSPILCNVRAYAHSSASFIVSKGYNTNNAMITILNANTSSTNVSYKYLKGMRILTDGSVQLKLNGGSSVSIQAQLHGNGVDTSLVATLIKDVTASPSVAQTVDPLVNGSIVANGEIYSGTSKVWHAGNLTPGNYVGIGNDQSVGTNFKIKGTLWVGDSPSTSGDIIIKDGSNADVIHLDGNSSGKQSSTNTKIYLAGNGNADFAGVVNINTLTTSSTTMIANLNAEMLAGKKETEYVKNVSITDITGYGVVSGMTVTQTDGGPTKTVTLRSGIVMTSSGKRFTYADQAVSIPDSSTNGITINVIYIRGEVAGNNEGAIAVATGTPAASPVEPSIPSDAVKIAIVRTRQGSGITIHDGSTTSYDDIDDARQWRPLTYGGGTLTLRSTVDASSIKENGTLLTSKYAQLGVANTFTGNQNISGRVKITSTGLGSGNYYVQISDGTNTTSLTPKEIIASDSLSLSGSTGVYVNTNVFVNNDGYVKASKNAATVTIPAGQTSVTWTHNYGATTYAVNPVSNSFERHVRWNNKTATTISIEIDTPTTEDILVDCILIGY